TILMWGMIRRFNLLAVVGKPLAAAVGIGAVMLLLPELALVILIPLSVGIWFGLLLLLRAIGAEEFDMVRALARVRATPKTVEAQGAGSLP
ncbi:MAG: hypothetical protein ACRC1H_07025, partial [Caldilineaceae bacterium]